MSWFSEIGVPFIKKDKYLVWGECCLISSELLYINKNYVIKEPGS